MADEKHGALAAPEAQAPAPGKPPKKPLRERFKGWLNRFVSSMQRAENDAAIVEMRRSTAGVPRGAMVNALGQMLYRVGQQTEYTLLQATRFVRRFLRWSVFGAALFGGAVLGAVRRFLLGVRHDLAEPFIRLFVGLANAARAARTAREEGDAAPKAVGLAYVRRGVRIYHRLIFSFLSYLLPVAAAAAFVFTVVSLTGTEFSLAVEYEGHFIGYVANETVWENARRLVTSRIIAAGSDEKWTALPTFELASVNPAARADATTLANRIVETSSEQIQEAVGIYVDDDLVGVCAEGYAQVQNDLDARLTAAAAAGTEGARAEYLHSITLVPGLYFTSSLTEYSGIVDRMEAAGQFRTMLIHTETYIEAVEYETIERETDELYEGSQRTVQRGVAGQRQVTADIVTVDGTVVETRVLSEEILSEPQAQIVEIGTKERPGYVEFSGQVGSGVLMFPVPDYSYITTQFGQGGHRGTDICAAGGAPIYACDSGTVIEAGWHGSWGNYILIDHGNGMTTRYAHCSALLAGAGTNVARGQLIALVGSTGYSSGNHLHLEVTVNGALTNPMNYF